ncbi:MAG: Fe-S protein assembly chaperone HscA [Pseudomonadota bacterium]|nr:Fe-S protein assembly chaperone HscA [Pseudomonadota bacterium]
MAILQISEPGQSPLPHQFKKVIGIDLGTTNSLVATVTHDGSREGEFPAVINDAEGRAMLPSVVHYASDGADFVGHQALILAAEDPYNTLASFKRLMGRSIDDIDDLQQFNVVEHNVATEPADAAAIIRLATEAGHITPIEASAEILSSLLAIAQARLGGSIEGAVITVPAYFDDAQRQATKDAAHLAGVNLLRLINEPTAAAVAYGLDKADDRTVVIYDLGGGTFDVSILQLSDGVFEVMATAGNSSLGGDDFDSAILKWALTEIQCLVDDLSPAEYRGLLAHARQIKEKLTDCEVETIDFFCANKNHQLELSRDQFNDLIMPLVNNTVDVCRSSLHDANLTPSDIADVVLVGGSTRVPLVQQRVEALFQQPPKIDVDPDQVVALGAAIQADTLIGNSTNANLLLLDVTPLSLGIETMGGLVEKIIHRNTSIPSSRAQEFTTYKDGQTALALHVLQGERDLVADCRSLARFELRGIPPMVAGAARIEVTFKVDADGLLEVSAQEMTTGAEANIQVKPSYGLAENEIADMLKASYSHAQQDRDARMLAEQKVEAIGLVEAVKAALLLDADLLDKQQLAKINNCIDILLSDIDTDDSAIISQSVASLGRETEEFAALRMDQSIRKALQGKNLDDVVE